MVQKARNASDSPTARAARAKGKTGRTNNAEASRAEILAAATREFSEKGLSGARVDEIAERTQINKRMIYYYFESKEGLYRAVLERCYGHIRMSESAMDLESLSPEDALRKLVRHTFDYHSMHPDFVRLVMNENIHQGAHIGSIGSIKTRNRHVLATLRGLLDRGVAGGSLPRRYRSYRAAHVDQRAFLLQRLESLHVLAHFRDGHELARSRCVSPRSRRGHHHALVRNAGHEHEHPRSAFQSSR